jgi:hypothetical protein
VYFGADQTAKMTAIIVTRDSPPMNIHGKSGLVQKETCVSANPSDLTF